jgi:hypothetical protein
LLKKNKIENLNSVYQNDIPNVIIPPKFKDKIGLKTIDIFIDPSHL